MPGLEALKIAGFRQLQTGASRQSFDGNRTGGGFAGWEMSKARRTNAALPGSCRTGSIHAPRPKVMPRPAWKLGSSTRIRPSGLGELRRDAGDDHLEPSICKTRLGRGSPPAVGSGVLAVSVASTCAKLVLPHLLHQGRTTQLEQGGGLGHHPSGLVQGTLNQ